MFAIALDSETHLIAPGLIVPPLVCVSYAFRENGQLQNGLLDKTEGSLFVRECLTMTLEEKAILILQNGVFDFGVFCAADPSLLPLVFEAYAKGGVRDTKERQKLIDLADGEMEFNIDPETGEFRRSAYSLEALAKRHLGIQLSKSDDSWRLRYSELDGTPIDKWPEDAKRYAMQDAMATLLVFEHQNKTKSDVVLNEQYVNNESAQLRAHWALHLQSIYGIRTDSEAVRNLRVQVETDVQSAMTQIMKMEEQHHVSVENRLYKSHTFKRGARAGEIQISRNMKAIQKRVMEGFLS